MNGARPHLIVGSGDARFALPIGPVRAVVRIERFTRVPAAPGHLLGLIAMRGAIAPAYCLARMLDAKAPTPGPGVMAVALDSGVNGAADILVTGTASALTLTGQLTVGDASSSDLSIFSAATVTAGCPASSSRTAKSSSIRPSAAIFRPRARRRAR